MKRNRRLVDVEALDTLIIVATGAWITIATLFLAWVFSGQP